MALINNNLPHCTQVEYAYHIFFVVINTFQLILNVYFLWRACLRIQRLMQRQQPFTVISNQIYLDKINHSLTKQKREREK